MVWVWWRRENPFPYGNRARRQSVWWLRYPGFISISLCSINPLKFWRKRVMGNEMHLVTTNLCVPWQKKSKVDSMFFIHKLVQVGTTERGSCSWTTFLSERCLLNVAIFRPMPKSSPWYKWPLTANNCPQWSVLFQAKFENNSTE
jgi:hypothetical protein